MMPTSRLVTKTEVMVTVEKPATTILGRMLPSIALISAAFSPALLAASVEKLATQMCNHDKRLEVIEDTSRGRVNTVWACAIQVL